ncbi:class E sortase [Rhizohabitans arisaemae]|uniref:class E sortase n=1 Tax=Rhizohabitans arisaemae TaxID=2720610 RepID=UPI0024B09954|nr:class E sortase [Rhizohabitans arisaemae]
MRVVLRTIGEVSVTLGAILLLFCVYLLWGTGSYTARQQQVLQRILSEEPPVEVAGKPRAGLGLGNALALLRIPRLGGDYRYALVEGVGFEELRRGPGHYPGTAMPGEIGNFVLSGHRTTYSAPFNRIDELVRGDEIIVETRRRTYTYEVDRVVVVDPADLGVVAPVPGLPGRDPSTAVITLITCHPEYSAAQRLIVFGRLVRGEERQA